MKKEKSKIPHCGNGF